MKDLNNYINQIDLIDNYRTHCPQTKKIDSFEMSKG